PRRPFGSGCAARRPSSSTGTTPSPTVPIPPRCRAGSTGATRLSWERRRWNSSSRRSGDESTPHPPAVRARADVTVPVVVDREELRRLVEEDHAQLVEVLPRDEYDDEHLPGAVHLPLKQLDAAAARTL